MADDTEKKPPLPKYEVEVPDSRGYAVDPRTGLALDPYYTRNPKNAKRTNPRGDGLARLDPDAPWGLE